MTPLSTSRRSALISPVRKVGGVSQSHNVEWSISSPPAHKRSPTIDCLSHNGGTIADHSAWRVKDCFSCEKRNSRNECRWVSKLWLVQPHAICIKLTGDQTYQDIALGRRAIFQTRVGMYRQQRRRHFHTPVHSHRDLLGRDFVLKKVKKRIIKRRTWRGKHADAWSCFSLSGASPKSGIWYTFSPEWTLFIQCENWSHEAIFLDENFLDIAMALVISGYN